MDFRVLPPLHAARIATMITTATTIGIVIEYSSMSGLQLSSTAARITQTWRARHFCVLMGEIEFAAEVATPNSCKISG